MVKEDEIFHIKQNISPEYFETFDADRQLRIINRLKGTIIHLHAIEEEFTPKHMEEIFEFLESRLDELQVIYNIKTNKKLDDFFK
ncbi:hypothetical protein KY362_02375 [Candidatus Woesearchaeota archaeon]|nr:hypothetical protein [Candidatus Woesearchaeota archaeon]